MGGQLGTSKLSLFDANLFRGIVNTFELSLSCGFPEMILILSVKHQNHVAARLTEKGRPYKKE